MSTLAGRLDVEDLHLNYDPEAPQERFRFAGLEPTKLTTSERLPRPVPWPDASKPTVEPIHPAPRDTDDLTRFKGYEAIVVTWTAAEAAALAALLTPDFLPSSWYEYRHDVDSYIPLVTGARAPFNDSRPDMVRSYHSLGLYMPCRIGKARVLLFKSGLHLDYDGPQTPLYKLIGDIVRAVGPKVLITTGTGGGIGKEITLGDVIIASSVRFFCTTQFAKESWSRAEYHTSKLPADTLSALTPALTSVNASAVVGGRATPRYWTGEHSAIVTTDFFGFDDSTHHYHLEGLGLACDMGDAMVARAMQQFPTAAFYAIRNASDPQIPNPSNDIESAKQEAGQIYAKYGAFTTAASVIATWAVIDKHFNSALSSSTM
jgi:hypothetical protein